MVKKDILVIHVPNFDAIKSSKTTINRIANFSLKHSLSSDNDFGKSDISFIPVGSIAIANEIEKSGKSCKIIAYSLRDEEKILNYIIKSDASIVFFPLNWSYSISSFNYVIKKVKKALPNAKIFLAGITASFFAHEIMRHYREVDGIVIGDGEKPSLDIVSGKRIDSIPNLLYREDGAGNTIKESTKRFVATSKDISNLDFSNLDLIYRIDKYKNILKYDSKNTFFFPLGRGCNMSCSGCGGGFKTHSLVSCRQKTSQMDKKSVIIQMEKLVQKGFERFHVSFDPTPSNPDYMINILSLMRKEKVDASVVFESWGLPDRKLIEDLSKRDDNIVELSPFCGSNIIRRKNRGYYFSNNNIIKTCQKLSDLDVNFKTYFSTRLPFEKMKDVMTTYRFNNKLISRFSNLTESMVSPYKIDIASPAFISPNDYGIEIVRKNYSDFLKSKSVFDKIKYPVGEFTNNLNMNINDIAFLLNMLIQRNHFRRNLE